MLNNFTLTRPECIMPKILLEDMFHLLQKLMVSFNLSCTPSLRELGVVFSCIVTWIDHLAPGTLFNPLVYQFVSVCANFYCRACSIQCYPYYYGRIIYGMPSKGVCCLTISL